MQSAYHDSPYTMLFQWFGLSLFLHVVLVTFVGGTQQIHPHRPLVVDIQRIPESTDPLTNSAIAPKTAPDIAVENPLPQAPTPDTSKNLEHLPALPKTAVDLPVPFESYLNINEVDVRAEPINDVPLPYPMAAFMRHIPGVVKLNLFINEQGKLDRIDLVGASPKGYFEQAAIDAVSKLYFQPATRYGRPVKSQKTIEVIFDPNPALDQNRPQP